MPLPLIPTVIALVAAGGTGVTAVAVGVSDVAEAKTIASPAPRGSQYRLTRAWVIRPTVAEHIMGSSETVPSQQR